LIFADFSLAGDQKRRFLRANFPFGGAVRGGLAPPSAQRA
jgi:hypothetical protein